jgi:MFS family permease
MMLLMKITLIWQRKSIGYIYGFHGEGSKAGDPIYEITAAYPNIHQYYGSLSGLLYTIPMSIGGLSLGMIQGEMSRKVLLAASMLIAGGSMFATGLVDSILVLSMMRIVHGMMNSVASPLCFSFVADYFPKNKRGTANSILQSANYIGIALSSIAILIINSIGWRNTYYVMGCIGVGLATLGHLFIREKKS